MSVVLILMSVFIYQTNLTDADKKPLYLEEKLSDRWFARLTSEPIELDLRTVELR